MTQPTHTPVAWRATGALLIGFCALALLVAILGIWGTQARISGAIIAPGIVQIGSKRQVIQHLHGGVVSAILVTDGDTVSAGDVVLVLEGSRLQSELTIVEGKLTEILARMARLEAERDGLARLKISPELFAEVERDPTVRAQVEGQKSLLRARALTLSQSMGQISEQIVQSTQQIAGTNAQVHALLTQKTLIEQELEDSQALLAKGLAPASRVSSLRREQARLLGDIGNLTARVAQLRGQIAGFELQRITLSTQHQQEATAALPDLRLQELELTQRRSDVREILSHLAVRAPISGVIFGSRVVALQSVVSAADPIMYVIPQDGPLRVVAQIEASHVDQIHVGQAATLRFAAADRRLTRDLLGQVSSRSADVFTDNATGRAFYQVDVQVTGQEAEKIDENVLLPGMPVEVFIKTQDRTPLNYLAEPLATYFHRAFKEG
jgi:HlyD family type I secretion membrane fusion protein